MSGPSLYKILGSGGYGAIIAPAIPNVIEGARIEYPGYITKLFKKKRQRNNILALNVRLEDLMGPNNGQRIYKYTKDDYKGSNLPINIRNQLEEKGFGPIINATPLSLVRMPNLGVDFDKFSEPEIRRKIRKIPLDTLLEQIVKLMTQIDRLWNVHHNIHGDIRETNIMIQPDTGVITLIDFDWLRQMDVFKTEYYNSTDSFGFYNNPPELMFLNRSIQYAPSDAIRQFIYDEIKNTYMNDTYEGFVYNMGIYRDSPTRTAKTNLLDGIQNAQVANETFLRVNQPFFADTEQLFSTFDSYGLANTLLNLIYYCYPVLIQPNYNKADIATIENKLRPFISIRGIPYTLDQLRACAIALRNLTYDVLYPMAQFKLVGRLPIAEGLARTRDILTSLRTGFDPEGARLAEEARLAQEAEAARLAEEARLAAEAEAEEARLAAEAARVVEEARLVRAAEVSRLAKIAQEEAKPETEYAEALSAVLPQQQQPTTLNRIGNTAKSIGNMFGSAARYATSAFRRGGGTHKHKHYSKKQHKRQTKKSCTLKRRTYI